MRFPIWIEGHARGRALLSFGGAEGDEESPHDGRAALAKRHAQDGQPKAVNAQNGKRKIRNDNVQNCFSATAENLRRLFVLGLFGLLIACVLPPAGAPCFGAEAGQSANPKLAGILTYISNGWSALTRSMDECKTLYDPKSSSQSVLYFPEDFPIPTSVEKLERSCPVRVQRLPVVIHRLGQIDPRKIQPAGLLYLPHPYVVPGGMFNEMYGWDSYFILRGLLQSGKLELARGMVENFLFEMEHYGGVLNANRTYYLTRSQPPFLTAMARAVYEAEKSRGFDDRAWLRKAYPFAVKDDQFWTEAPHPAGTTGLSRYFDFGQGPAPEMSAGYYRRVAGYFLLHPQSAQDYLLRGNSQQALQNSPGPIFPVYVCNPGGSSITTKTLIEKNCDAAGSVGLSEAFYKGDRSLRESGFDITFKFGPFGAATPDYAPVGLNCLLYQEEKNLEWMARELGHSAEAQQWRERAEQRRERITKYFWNPQRGLYFDYNFKSGKQSDYIYATTFYPLWVGAASREQADAVIRNLKQFEEPGGIVMSRQRTGAQWDYPYGWAPLQLIAVEGLRRYGDQADADRISSEFLSMVAENFERDHTIREKYNVVTRSSETAIQVGYTQNVIGFGWTNGVFLVLLHELPAASRSRLSALALRRLTDYSFVATLPFALPPTRKKPAFQPSSSVALIEDYKL
ncbi:MAG TPA: trehalase family glycosidase [Terriglobia bacterium]|nr:trehalase family glycosidase [Terriglobia bacterium]